MLDGLMNAVHNLGGTAYPTGALNQNSITATNIGPSLMSQMEASRQKSGAKRIFAGHIEVMQVSNGYIVNIGTREGYEYDVHIASTIAEVNEIIASQMVAFRLESKT
jgi:hypothetical protein